MVDAVYALSETGAKNVLLKGGHLNSKKLTDVLLYNGEIYKFVTDRIDTEDTHGTGCSMSSAIATNLAKGQKLHMAVKNAVLYVQKGITNNFKVGKGKNPINHFHKCCK